MRTLTRTSALILLPALLVTTFLATASALASPATETKGSPLQVYGERTWPLERSIAYWNDAAGHEVIRYAGRVVAPAAASDPHTVDVKLDLLTGVSGVTGGIYGQTARAITIDSRNMFEWGVYAHEFGHALGYHDHNDDPRYDGVMADDSMRDPNPKADQMLLISHGDAG